MEVPHWFKQGLKFTSKYIPKLLYCKLESYDIVNNKCSVKVVTEQTSFTEDDWNLQHTLWAFESGDYKAMRPNEISYMAVPGYAMNIF